MKKYTIWERRINDPNDSLYIGNAGNITPSVGGGADYSSQYYRECSKGMGIKLKMQENL